MPRDWHPKLGDRARRCLLAAHIAVTSYVSDVKINIRALVQVMVDEGLASHDHDDHTTAVERRRFLKVWLKCDHPLGFGEQAFPALLRAISIPGRTPRLVYGNKKAMSTLELSWLICEIVRVGHVGGVEAPLIAKSPSLAVFRVAVAYMLKQATQGDFSDPASFVAHAIAQTFDRHHVAHVPWSPLPTAATAGRPLRKVNFHFWRSTSKTQDDEHLAHMKVVDAQAHASMADDRMAHQAALTDAKAPWALLPLTIGELPSIMHKVTLPDDYSLSHASLSPNDGYITDTYEWVSTHYNGANHMHMFALLVAHIFSRMAPNLGHPPMPRGLVKGNTRDVTAAVRTAAWIFDDRRGVTDPDPFVIMVSTYIIAMVEDKDQCPLGKYLVKTKSLGPWAKKHGTISLHFSSFDIH